jgi:urea transport system substrate-binding protein
MGISRRALLKSGAAAAVCAPALLRSAAAAGDPIVIASMYDLSGGLEAAGKPMYDVLNFAVDEMNAAGGLLGREIKVVSFDTQTNMQLYAQYAQEAALKNKVAVVHGGITSASREVIRRFSTNTRRSISTTCRTKAASATATSSSTVSRPRTTPRCSSVTA